MMRDARRKSGRAGLARQGRPGLWSAALQKEFLARIEDGRGLVEVCSEPDMPTHTTVYRWLRARPAFAEAYALARQVQSDLLFDLAWSVARRAAEGEGDIAGARLIIDAIKWRCGRIAPRRYGTATAAARAEREEMEEARQAYDESPLLITPRHFERSEDGKSVVEVFPEDAGAFVFERKRRG